MFYEKFVRKRRQEIPLIDHDQISCNKYQVCVRDTVKLG